MVMYIMYIIMYVKMYTFTYNFYIVVAFQPNLVCTSISTSYVFLVSNLVYVIMYMYIVYI